MNQRDIRRSLRPLPNSTQQTEPVRKARQNYHARRPQTNATLGRRWRKTSQRKKCEGKSSIKQQVGELQTARPTARRRKSTLHLKIFQDRPPQQVTPVYGRKYNTITKVKKKFARIPNASIFDGHARKTTTAPAEDATI